jgi:antirestriction protein ArdC
MDKPKNREDYKKQLAESFINCLAEQGLEWKKEWSCSNMPFNVATNYKYKGINKFFLQIVALNRGYNDPRWVTMIQIMDKNHKYHPKEKWHLQKGSKCTYVEYWFPYDLKNKKNITWDEFKKEIKENDRSEQEFTLKARYTPVFNASCIDGISPYEPEKPNNPNVTQEDIISKLSANMQVEIINDGGDRAYYAPYEDKIHLPEMQNFYSSYAYNATALHELAHSTGAEKRLNRKIQNIFGSEEYAFEELIAEMTSAFMAASCSCFDINEPNAQADNHKAYVKSWCQHIRKDPDVLLKAIAEAEKACNYMEYKAELITEAEYKATKESTHEVDINNVRYAVDPKEPAVESKKVELNETEIDDDLEL